MVIGIICYQFNLNQTDFGDIEPKFRIIARSHRLDYNETPIEKLISNKEKFRLFYEHTAGFSADYPHRAVSSTTSGRLKDSPYKLLSHYQKTSNGIQTLTIALFEWNMEVEIVENLFSTFVDRLEEKFKMLTSSDLDNIANFMRLQDDVAQDVQFCVFQMERFSNLTKLQKAALIFATYEREYCLRLLRKAPISRTILQEKLEQFKPNINIDVLLKPFIELNLIRRDWVKGVKNKKTGIIYGTGEYIFLIKDIILVRMPPKELIGNLQRGSSIRTNYLKEIKEFYENYSPFEKMDEESNIFAHLLLEPDTFDFLALLRNKAYPLKKIPRVISQFSQMREILDRLISFNILRLIPDDNGQQWVCMVSDITPLVVFPEYLVNNIADRTAIKLESIDEKSLVAPITKEIGALSLKLLELTYEEKVEF
ncbi:MAG: hypothetical protein ACTSWC_06385 [Promethearchaeota archaeon]